MNDWSHGYDVSEGYTYGFRHEMAPDWMDLCARLAGQEPPRTTPGQRFRYLELGCGQGIGLCLLAAANPQGDFVGVDFLPDHIDHARAVAAAAGLDNIYFSDGDFVQLASDWPEKFGRFDYVTLHGVYSWISAPVRAALVDCLAHATAPGALVYVAYNGQPGWLGSMPFRHITRLLRETSDQPSTDVLSQSIEIFDRMAAGGASTFQILPGLKARVAAVKKQSPNYVIHEFMHEGWHPFWASEVAAELDRAGLGFVGTATIAETLLPTGLPPALRQMIEEQSVDSLRQDIQDFIINQSFRRDIFRRRRDDASATHSQQGRDMDALGQMQLHLLTSPQGAALDVKTSFAEISLQRPAFQEVVNALAEGPASIANILDLPAMQRQGMANALNVLALLLHGQCLATGPAGGHRPDAAMRLNRVIAEGAAKGVGYTHIAAAALGSAIPVSAVELALLDAWLSLPDRTDPIMLAERVQRSLTAAGRLSSIDTQASDLRSRAATFLDTDLSRWHRLGALA